MIFVETEILKNTLLYPEPGASPIKEGVKKEFIRRKVARYIEADSLPQGDWGKVMSYSPSNMQGIVEALVMRNLKILYKKEVDQFEGVLDPDRLEFLESPGLTSAVRMHFTQQAKELFFNFSAN